MATIDDTNDDIKPSTIITTRTMAISSTDWKFGYDGKAEAKTRVIVSFKDSKGERWIREYDKDSEAKYFCVGCLKNKRIKNFAQLINNEFLVPTFHDCPKICPIINAAEQKEKEQKFINIQRIAASSSSTPNENEKPINSVTKKSTILSSSKKGVSKTPIKHKPTNTPVPDESQLSSPIFLCSMSQTPNSNSFKSKITDFFAQKDSSIMTQQQTPKSTPMKQNTAETPTLVQRQTSKINNEQENKQSTVKNATVKDNQKFESKNGKTKKTSIADDILLIEDNETESNMDFEYTDFDDYPETFNTPQFLNLQSDAASAPNNKNVESSKIVNNEKNGQQDVDVIHTTEKMQRTKRTMLEEDICLIELAGSSEDLESLSDENVITEFQNAEITVVTESEPVIHVISDPPTTSSRASNISNTATKNVEKLTPAYINSLKKRDLKLDEFEFGVDGRNKEECRILVSDENDKNAFRMYAKYQGKWYCRQCDKKTSRKIWGILKNGIFSAPPKHLCLPITRKKWENEQKYIKERFSNSSLLSSHSNISLTKDSEQQTRKSTSSVACNETVSSISNDFTTSRPSTSLSSSSTNMHTNEFREVDTCDAEYGFNEYGKIKGRLIVREPGNRKFVREYTVTEATKNWRCLNCKIGIAKKNENGNFFVSTNHDCAAISYATIQENQNLFEAKYKQLTNSPSKKVSRCESQMSKSSFNSSIISQNENGISNSTSFSSLSTTTESSMASPILHKIPSSQWEWGCDATGNEKMRIIIFDKNDKNQVHEYRNGGKKLLCLGCHAKNGKYIWASRSDDTENPIISIPPPEEHVCESRSLKEVREQQRTFKKKGQKRGRNDNDISESEVEGPREIKRTRKSAQIATEKLTNCFKDCDNISTEKDESDNEESENSKKPRRKSAIVIERDTETSTSPFEGDDENDSENIFNNDFDYPEPLSSDFIPAPSEVVREDNELMKDISDDTIVPLSTFKKNFSLSNNLKPFKFYYPSSADIEKCCEKLHIPYSNLANMFWGQLNIAKITPTSIPNKLFSVCNEERSGFAAFSLFLTGVETNALTIKDNFNKIYFSQNLAEMGKYYGEDFSLTYDGKTIQILFSDILTKYHLQALCHFFECRIGIFADEKWERYGSWNDETANILTFLMKKDADKFYPILSLMQQ